MAAEGVTSEARAERSEPGTGKGSLGKWGEIRRQGKFALREDARAMRLGLLPIPSGHFLNPSYGDTWMEYQLLLTSSDERRRAHQKIFGL